MQWPNFLYAEGTTRDDDAWLGLFRGELLVTVIFFLNSFDHNLIYMLI